MPQINPYYVGSLDTIGNNMSRDYATDAQLRAAELQARNQFAQILQQAMQAQQNRQQQGGQFDQEMAYRNAALQQQGQLRGQELGQNQGQFDANLNYMREALKQQLANQLDLGRMQYSSDRNDPRVAAALIDQQGRTARDQAELDAGAELFNNTAQAKAAQYNALLENLAQEAKQIGRDKGSWLPWDPSEKDAEAQAKRAGMTQLINSLSADKSAEGVSFDQVQGKFVPVLRTRRQIAPQANQPNSPWSFLLQLLKGGGQPGITQPLAPQTRTSSGASGGWSPDFQVGGIYEQNGKKYRFDGTNFTEVASGL